ncbi:MAG: hypothetical protein UEP57_11985 [Oscillospiraceae bacterium]|nr:hypothetical protein [Oscillospiraceae bacterium]
MKKIISVLVAFLMMLTIPIHALAIETKTAEQEELFALACNVFPEYAAVIRGEETIKSARSLDDDSNEIIYSCTRFISDSESVSIAVCADSSVIVARGKYDNTKVSLENSSVTTVGPDTIGSASFKASCTGASGIFYLNNVGFIITQSGSGAFTSYGSYSTSGSIAIGSTNNSSTYIYYNLTFNSDSAGSSQLPYKFSLYFDNGYLYALLD